MCTFISLWLMGGALHLERKAENEEIKEKNVLKVTDPKTL